MWLDLTRGNAARRRPYDHSFHSQPSVVDYVTARKGSVRVDGHFPIRFDPATGPVGSTAADAISIMSERT
jgi:hypothetical protein